MFKSVTSSALMLILSGLMVVPPSQCQDDLQLSLMQDAAGMF
jgi:hypothetical protein